VADIEAGQNYTFPENSDNGYYDGTNAYAAGSTITVNNDITVTSIGDISVAMAYGAGIKLDADNDTSGIRFQAKVTADSNVLSAIATEDSAINSGMLITARDIYENKGADLTVDNYAKYYAKNISNAGWMSNQPEGTFSGSIVNIAQSNYIREFIAKAYVTITYADGTSKTVYSGMSEVRSINYVASAIKKAGYVGLSEAEKAIVDSYLAVK
jgi:hypothetical protein